MTKKLSDPSAERAVLAGLCKYGESAYLDIADLISSTSFTIDSNQLMFNCIRHIYEETNAENIDLASILSTAQELGYSNILSSKEEALHIKAILVFPVERTNIRRFAAKIKKLEIARTVKDKLLLDQNEINKYELNPTSSQPINITKKFDDITSKSIEKTKKLK